MRRLRSLLPLAAFTFVLAACGSSGAGQATDTTLTEQESQLYSLASDEPALTWYSSQDPARNDAVIEAFLAKYPDVEATSFRLASGELANRYSQETEAGVKTAGLLTLASPEFVAHGKDEGWFKQIEPGDFPELSNFPKEFVGEGVVTVGINTFGIGYNTDAVQNPPADWQDLLDGSYKGKIVFGDPRNVPAYVALATVWIDEYGEDFLTRLSGQELTLVDSMVPGMQQIAAGEGSVGLPSVQATVNPVKDKGAPLEMVVPEVTTGNEFQALIPKDGPSPHTAELLYQFLLTEEGQQAFNGTAGASPIKAEGTAALPGQYRTVSLEDIAENRDRVLKLLGIQQ